MQVDMQAYILSQSFTYMHMPLHKILENTVYFIY